MSYQQSATEQDKQKRVNQFLIANRVCFYIKDQEYQLKLWTQYLKEAIKQ